MKEESMTFVETISSEIHDMWMSWAKELIETESNISTERIERWKKDCFKPYEQLSEEMKQLDRNYAVKIFKAIKNERKT